jgi:CRP-like cAMP-binding protein/ActR/RegA family two-component response regulator
MTKAMLQDRRILVVEDEYVIAENMQRGLEKAGAIVLGPVPSVKQALELLGKEPNVDGAVLDINLAGEKVFPVADALTARKIRFLFATGYSASDVPLEYQHVTRFGKPVDAGAIIWNLKTFAKPVGLRQSSSSTEKPREQTVPSSSDRPNRLLRALSQSDRDLLQPYLEPVFLNNNDVCIEPGETITHVYFLEGGLSSTIVPDSFRGRSELGMHGFEGMIGIPAILGADQSPNKHFMQVGGPAMRIAVEPLREAMEKSATLRRLLLLYVQVYLVQVGQTAYSNARFSIEERLARWLLMSADRLGPDLLLTHQFLSFILGIRRAGITDAIHVLEGEGMIRSTRGMLKVHNRAGLEKRASDSYGVPEAEYERLIGLGR